MAADKEGAEMINSFYGWLWNWPNMKPQPKPEAKPCVWRYEGFLKVEDCEADGTTEIGGHWYCDEHATDDMSYGRVGD